MNEVNIIEINSNKKYPKNAGRSYRHNKVTFANINIYHKPYLNIQQEEHDSKLQQ